MGACASKPKRKSGNPKDKDKARHKEEDEFHDIKNEKNNRKKDSNDKKSANLSSEDSDSSSDSSDSSGRPAKVRSSKKMKRTKNGGLVMVSNKTTIGGDNIVIGEGSKIVNVNIGDRRDRRDRRSKPRSRRSEPSQKPDFSVLKLWKPTSSKRLPGCFMQLEDRSVYVVDQEILTQVAKSVGKIHAAGTYCATVFRVGPNYIMTAKHVIDGILDNEYNDLQNIPGDRYRVLKNKSVYVDFEYTLPGRQSSDSIKFFLTSNVAFADDEHDVAVVELQKNDNPNIPFPPEFTRYSIASPNRKFTFIGHPNGKPKLFNEVDGPVHLTAETYQVATAWSLSLGQPTGFNGIERSSRILFHCSFEKGGSGSPGIAVTDGQEAVVVTMLLQGYPGWYYDANIDQSLKANISKNQRIEQGVNMLSLYKKMHTVNTDLCIAIFGHPT